MATLIKDLLRVASGPYAGVIGEPAGRQDRLQWLDIVSIEPGAGRITDATIGKRLGFMVSQLVYASTGKPLEGVDSV